MGKKGIVLKQIPYSSTLGRQIDAPLRIEKHPVIKDDLSPVGLFNTGNAFKGHAFPAARRSQDADILLVNLHPDIQGELRKLFFYFHRELHTLTSLKP